jgi:hypothetical protein
MVATLLFGHLEGKEHGQEIAEFFFREGDPRVDEASAMATPKS